MTHGMVAAPHRLASEAGAQVFRDGGNAIDAAVAANAVLCVVYPHMTSIGGDLFGLVWPAGGERPVALAGAGRSGSLATADAVRRLGHETMPQRGALTVTVPGTPQAWGQLLERYGSFGMGRVMEPAAALARDGFEVTESLSFFLHENANWILAEPDTAALFPPLKAGMSLRNPDLAETLDNLGRRGWIGFYRGEVAEAIVRSVSRRGGFLVEEDLHRHRGEWMDPVSADYRGLEVFQCPPPSQGLVLLGLLVRMAARSEADLKRGPGFARILNAIRDQVYPLRDRHITDPEFNQAPLEPFLDPAAAAIAEGAAIPEGDTIHLCSADEHGNAVAITQSVANSFGSGIVAEGAGFLLHNRGLYFSLDARSVNVLEPRKRTMHTLMPALAGRDGRPWAAFGTMGADGQPQIMAQVLSNLVDHRMEPSEAVAAARIRVHAGGGAISVEADYPGAGEIGRSELNATLLPPRSHFMGHAQAVVVDGPRAWRGGADPRSDGSVEIV